MSVSCIVNRVKSLLIMVVTLFKRVLCIFQKRRRKPSGDEIIMENVVIDNCKRNQDQFVPWNSWDDNRPPTVEDHIEQYRKSLTKLRTASEEIAHEPDFFNDMTPNIKTNNALELNFNPIPNPSQRVTFEVQEDFNSSVFISPELGEILDEEDRTVGWDADEDLSHVLKQQRSEERKKRSSEHNQKKKDSRKSTSLSNGN